MQKLLSSCIAKLSLLLLPATVLAAPNPLRGLWVGEVTVNKVNQVGADAYLQAGAVPPAPTLTTPTASSAAFRVLVHVDANGQARLLKSVAVFGQGSSNSSASLALVTDPSLYPQGAGVARRISAVAFDFGELAAYRAITNVAETAANAAATAAAASGATYATISTAVSAATAKAIGAATTNVISPVYTNYYQFVSSTKFTAPAANAGTAASTAAYQALTNGGVLPEVIRNRARSAALEALTSAFRDGGAITRNEIEMAGTLAPGNSLSATFFLGAFHPTNPFRHRRHPDHTQGLDIIRTVELRANSAPSGTGASSGGYGVDTLSGIYKEEIHGLHKPLGPDRNIGLRTEGVFTLSRASLVDTLIH